MGQILGMGYQAGDKSKAQTSVNAPPELRQMWRNQTNLAQSMMPQYQELLQRAMSGDTSVADPYVGSLASTFRPMESTYQPIAGTYQSQEASFLPGAQAYTAPMAASIQNAQQQIRRATPAGGGQTAALAQATMQGGVQMGQARAQQVQRDIDARNALRQQDIATKMGLNQKDIQTLMALRGQDVQTQMGLQAQDVTNRSQMMQKLLQYYSAIFGGFNPQSAVGSTQTSSTPGRLGFPGWEMLA